MSNRPYGPGLFSASEVGKWEWRGNVLVDALGHQIAAVRSDVLVVGEERILIEYSHSALKFRIRATTGNGEISTVRQRGISLKDLDADCAGRKYTLTRTSLWSKERVINSDSGLVAIVRPLPCGNVEILDKPGETAITPLVDAVFLSWACVLADAAVRHPRLAK
ncbi:hypothetical protein [Corynebacterium caspium]|uniref:hypothetical protein n=1 Tax=Corynebacterium caspium TaxID=234828 RepID=UPI00036A4C91|nr:hypothetical protein [Corynebacterium caspium]WKD58905.1 hypothetical protein CCASP_02485 [Corynebacterium caspium DSM 44850]